MLTFAFGKAAGRLVADAARQKRKVRATQSIPLPNGKLSAKVESCRRKEPPCFGKVRVRRWGKSPPAVW